MDYMTPIQDSTATGAKYLGAGVQRYLIYGLSEGSLGYGYGEPD